jgi:uncharacterized ubiquitin-like protein YukD
MLFNFLIEIWARLKISCASASKQSVKKKNKLALICNADNLPTLSAGDGTLIGWQAFAVTEILCIMG